MSNTSSLLLVAALCLSGVSAYYSIVGLAAIFHSAWFSVVVLASVLEICKLVLASWLYRNWHRTHGLLKTYLTSAVIVLMLITSMGIFGFLSRAHVEQDTVNQSTQLRLAQLDVQLGQKQADLERIERDLAQLDRSINIQLNANRAQSAINTRRQQTAERNRLRTELETTQNTILELNEQKTNLRQLQNNQMSKLGPLVYVAELFGMDGQDRTAVKWMIVILVLVCDPLAVLMLIAANSAMSAREIQPAVGSIKWDGAANCMVFWDGNQWQIAESGTTVNQSLDHEQLISHVDQRIEGLITRLTNANTTLNHNTAQLLDDRLLQFKTESQQNLQAAIKNLSPIINQDQLVNLIQSRLDHCVAQLEAAKPQEVATVNQDQLVLLIQQTQEEWLARLQAAIHKSESPMDQDQLVRLIQRTLEEWLQGTLTVSYTADHTEIQSIVDKAIQQLMTKIDRLERTDQQHKEILDNHRGHAINSPTI